MSPVFKFMMAMLLFGVLVVWGAHLLIETVANIAQAHVAAINEVEQ